ncbi:MAG TPA: DUF3592 domain-containing protein [Ktedonosporobacter sp.]|jgi:hypothetical protein|nr:DUF3592 domain-containing protein [Ktedonosporobacter sp.]
MRSFFALLSLLSFATCIVALLVGGGLLFALIGFWALWREFHFSKHGLTVPGEVIAIDTRREGTRKGRGSKGRGSTTVYDAVVRFQTLESADPVTFIVNTGSFRVYQVNQPVTVIYLPADPQQARIEGRHRWVGPWLLSGFSLFFVACTIVFALGTLK